MLALAAKSQDLTLTFNGSAGETIEKVVAFNLTTHESITVMGNSVVLLSDVDGMET